MSAATVQATESLPLAWSPSRDSDVTVTLAGALPSPPVVLLKLAATCALAWPAYVMSWTWPCDQALANRSAELRAAWSRRACY